MADEDQDFNALLSARRVLLGLSPSEDTRTPEDFVEEGFASFNEQLNARASIMKSGTHLGGSVEEDLETSRNQFFSSQLKARGFSGEIGEPGADIRTRAFLGQTNVEAEKQLRFETMHPEGTRTVVRDKYGSLIVMQRRSPREPFAPADMRAMDGFEIGADLADVSGEAWNLAAEAAALGVLTIFDKGASFYKELAAVVGAHVTAEFIKERIEDIQGYQLETFTEQTTRMAIDAGFVAAGTAGSVILTGPLRAFRGARIADVEEGAEEAIKAAAALDIPPLTPMQIAQSPIIRQLGRQTRRLVSTVDQYVRRQKETTVAVVNRMRDADILLYAAGDVAEVHDGMMRQVEAGIITANTSLSRAGTQISQGIAEYDMASQALVDRAYGVAKLQGVPVFDITPALEVANKLERGRLAKSKRDDVIRDDGTVEPSTTRINPKLENDVKIEIDRLRDLDPDLPTFVSPDGDEVTGVDALRNIRSNLFHLMQEPINATPPQRVAARQAREMFFALDGVLKSPKNNEPGFLAAWAKANKIAKDRFDTLEKAIVVQASKTETPEQMARQLVAPYQFSNLEILKKAVPANRWAAFKDAAITEITAPNNIDNLAATLKSFDKETLDILFDAQDQAALRVMGEGVERLKQAKIQSAVKMQTRVPEMVQQLLLRNDTAGIDTFVEQIIALPLDHPTRKMIRAGLAESIWRSVVKVNKNRPEIDPEALKGIMNTMKHTGIDRLLTPENLDDLGNLNQLVDWIGMSSDAGAAMQTAEVAAGVGKLKSAALMTLLHAFGMGRAITNERFSRFLFGSGNPARAPKSGAFAHVMLRVMGATMTEVAFDIEDLELPGEGQ